MSAANPVSLLVGYGPFSQLNDCAEPAQPCIFVSIPSYRDVETQWTVKDLFEMARYPDRVFVGICWQFDHEQDAHCFVEPYSRPAQVRVIDVPAAESRGANWARSQAMSLWQGEPYVLMIDAHMRFERHWDEMLLDMLQQCPSNDAVLTTFPTQYTPPDKCDRNGIKLMAFREFTAASAGAPPKLRYRSFRIKPPELPTAPVPTATVAHGFMFASARLFQAVLIDPHIYFFGDELTFATRAWTHGWDFYSPHRPVLFHLWDRTTRPRHAHDQPAGVRLLRRRSAARVAHLVGIERCTDPHALVELAQYGFGSKRSLREYECFSGVDFKNRTLAPHAMAGKFGCAPAGIVSAAEARIFIAIRSYRDEQTQWTLKNLFAAASKPHRVTVGICWQFEPSQDAHCFAELYAYPKQVRVVGTLASQTKGGCWAHEQALALAQGEDYVLIIDSHMRFVPGWDEKLINVIESANDPKAVLTAWLPGYMPPDTLRAPPAGRVRRIAVKKFSHQQHPSIVHLKGITVAQEQMAAVNPTPFLVANFIFTRASTFGEVPVDPHIHLYGEEITLSARLWTRGYTLYEPGETLAYHYWKPPAVNALDLYKGRDRPSVAANNARVRHLLRLKKSRDPAALVDLDRYALGSERTLESLWQFAGVDLVSGVVSEDASHARWNLGCLRAAPATTTHETAGNAHTVGAARN